MTGQASVTPSAAAMRLRSASVVAGTMRSTICRGKRNFVGCEIRVVAAHQFCELQKQPAQGDPVGRQVVAAEHREGRSARPRAGAPKRSPRKPRALRGLSTNSRSHSMSEWPGVEVAIRPAQIGLLGDRQCHDPHARVGELCRARLLDLRAPRAPISALQQRGDLRPYEPRTAATRVEFILRSQAHHAYPGCAATRRLCPSRAHLPPGSRRHKPPDAPGERRQHRDERSRR